MSKIYSESDLKVTLLELEGRLLTAIDCLAYESGDEDAGNSMKFSQAALNLAHTLQILKSIHNE
jgi:hypothetical protein